MDLLLLRVKHGCVDTGISLIHHDVLLIIFMLDHRLSSMLSALLVILHDGAEYYQRMQIYQLEALVEFSLIFLTF